MRRIVNVCVMVLAMVALSFIAQGQKAQFSVGQPKTSDKELPFLTVKVGYSRENLPPLPKDDLAIDPLMGAVVILIDQNDLVVGMETTNREGLTSWPHQDGQFSVLVALAGRKLVSFHGKDNKRGSVLVRLPKK